MCHSFFKPWSVALLALSFSTLVPAAQAQPCDHDTAPTTFEYHSEYSSTGQPIDPGIVTHGFVDVRGEQVVHGIDVSKWQDKADFTNLRDCLGKTEDASSENGMHEPFVYVRISSSVDPDNETFNRAHWYNARDQSLFVGPYHTFSIGDSASAFLTLPQSRQNALQDADLESARTQAKIFIQQFGQLLDADPTIDVSPGDYGKPYLPIVLTLMERPQANNSVEDRHAIGKLYGAAACEWMSAVRSHPSFRGQKIILFTSPSIFYDYDLASAPCDLGADGVWMSAHTLDGSRFGDLNDLRMRQRTQALCKSIDKDSRCILQQYTSYGGFALFDGDSPLDLDRFYGTVADLSTSLQHAKHPELWTK